MKYPLEVTFKYASCENCGYGFAPSLTFTSDEQISAPVVCPRCGHHFDVPREHIAEPLRAAHRKERAKIENWEIDCLRCKTKMRYLGQNRLILDTENRRMAVFLAGDLQHFFENCLIVELFKCPKCNHVEIFMPADRGEDEQEPTKAK